MNETELNAMFLGAGVTPKSRYDIDEVALVLGLEPEQVRELLKKRRLKGFKTSERRWTTVLHLDLEDYLSELNGGAR